jgi:hypothetical protein
MACALLAIQRPALISPPATADTIPRELRVGSP